MNGIATTLRILAVLWMLGLVTFWVVVRFVPNHGLGLPNPLDNPFDIRNSIDLVLSVIFFSIEAIPALVLLWLAAHAIERRRTGL